MFDSTINTYTGKRIDPFNDPKPDDIDITDIAHALSNICRFGGHCKEFYSVAQHSVLVSVHLPQEYQLWGLLHDASEAYICDIPTPEKNHPIMEGYRNRERFLMYQVAQKFKLKWQMPGIVHEVDVKMLISEALIFGFDISEWGKCVHPITNFIKPVPPVEAEAVFLDWYETLMSR